MEDWELQIFRERRRQQQGSGGGESEELWDMDPELRARLAVTEESGDLGHMRQMFQRTDFLNFFRTVSSINTEIVPHERIIHELYNMASPLPAHWRYRSVRVVWTRLESYFLFNLSRRLAIESERNQRSDAGPDEAPPTPRSPMRRRFERRN